jgi:hypothetical protein
MRDLGFCIRNSIIYSEQLERATTDKDHRDARLPYFSYNLDPDTLSIVSGLEYNSISKQRGCKQIWYFIASHVA